MKVSYLNQNNSTKTTQIEFADFIADVKNEKYKGVDKNKRPLIMASINFEGKRPTIKTATEAMYSQLICVDIDKLPTADIDTIRSMAGTDKHVYAIMVSPSGNGLKIFVKVDSDLQQHGQAYTQVCKYLAEQYDIEEKHFDHTADVVRLCYYPSDKDVRFDAKAETFHVETIPVQSGIARNEAIPVLSADEIKKRFRDCVKWTNQYKQYAEGSRNVYVFTLACSCNRKGIPKDVALDEILKLYNYDETEVTTSVHSAYKNESDFAKYANESTMPLAIDPHKIYWSDKELMALDLTGNWLADGILRSVGLSVVGGIQDTGKSLLLRQLCININYQIKDFLGCKITARHNRALFLTTEENEFDIAETFSKQMKGLGLPATERFRAITAQSLTTPEILIELENYVSQYPCDLLVIDAFGDIIEGEINSTTNIRKTLAPFNYMAAKHQLQICFIHHLTKAAVNQSPNMRHLSGGFGISQKVRTALQLSSNNENGTEKFLTVTKGNNLKHEAKKLSRILKLDEETCLFHNTGTMIVTDGINTGEKRQGKEERLQKLADEILGDKVLSYSAFCKAHQETNGTSPAQAQRDHRAMKESGIIIKEGKNWKLSDEGSILSAA